MKLKKAVIPAAGLGTRLLPATKAQPKEMLPIVDKPTLQYIVEEAIDSGIEEILIITGRNKQSIENHFDKSVELELELKKSNKIELLEEIRKISDIINIHYIRQKEPLGLGHAIYCAKSFIGNEPFAILLGDDIVYSNKPCLKQMIEIYDKYKTTILGIQEVPREDVNKYGIVEGKIVENRIYKVNSLIEKPEIKDTSSNLAVLGRYIVSPTIFEILKDTNPGKNGEIQLTDALSELAKCETVYAFNFEGRRYDVGSIQGFLEATVEYALRRKDLRNDFLKYLIKIVEGQRYGNRSCILLNNTNKIIKNKIS